MENTAILTARQLKPPDRPPAPVSEPAETRPSAGQAPLLRDMPLTPEKVPATEEPPRAERAGRTYAHRRRSRIPALQLFAALIGAAAGVFFAMSAPEGADFSGSLLCASGDFAGLLVKRLLWGGAFLLAEYICGYFALGWLLVWAAPLICGLGTGAALAGAFTAGANAALLIIPAAGAVFAVVMGAGTSRLMSSQLLQLVSSERNSIVSASPAAGEYTLRFLLWFAVLAGCAIAETAIRVLA